MSQKAKPGATGPAEFVKRHPFEPMPGELGMNLDQLREAGLLDEGTGTTQGAYFALLGLIKSLKARRLSKGLSLTEVSRRSSMTRQAISKLENGQVSNPTLDTIYRYGLALGAGITLGFEEIDPEEHEGLYMVSRRDGCVPEAPPRAQSSPGRNHPVYFGCADSSSLGAVISRISSRSNSARFIPGPAAPNPTTEGVTSHSNLTGSQT